MTFFQQLLLSIGLGTIVYTIIWWINILRFRSQTLSLIYLYLYILIAREVGFFHLKEHNGLATIIAIDKNGEPMTLKPLAWVVKVINHHELFDTYKITENEYKCVPNSDFLMVSLDNQRTIVTDSKRLHDKYNEYTWISKRFLKKYNTILNQLDEKTQNIAQNKVK